MKIWNIIRPVVPMTQWVKIERRKKFEKMVKLVDGGSVINGAYPVKFT